MHTSAIRCAASKKRLTPKVIQEMKAVKRAEEQAKRASPILGTLPGEEFKWEKCDLAKILVKEEELAGSPEMTPTERPIGRVNEPQEFAFGITKTEASELFGALPILSNQILTQSKAKGVQDTIEYGMESAERELRKANMFAKVVDLRNADAGGIAYENRRRIIEAFSSPENPFDPGRSEVQAAILTYRIHNLWNHLKHHKADVGNRRSLRQLVHHRARILKYLKRTKRERYDALLEQLGLHPSSVEGELVV
ncbi:hypothetical protein V5O48_007794 [Marasmius crinis-equi]|uniref:30S ribosomal protein S15 n=1 Tax=Marasmius crinis-equi TaxID=585013 RepID=A0ABR3FFN6_9AGAR